MEKTDKKEKKDDDSSSEESSNGSSDSSSSSGSSDSDSDGESKKGGDESGSEEEQEVVKKGELPKKYAFMGLPHDEKTPQQRRWKWVKFEFLPEDLRPYIRPPTKNQISKQE